MATSRTSEFRQSLTKSWVGVDVLLFGDERDNDVEKYNHNTLTNSQTHGTPVTTTNTSLQQKDDSGQTTASSPLGASLASVVCAEWRRGDGIRSSEVPSIDKIKSWDFDVLAFTQPTLVPVAEQMLDFFNIYENFSVDRKIMNKFIRDTMTHHSDTADYHNWYHAVSTMHMSFVFITLAGDATKYLSDCEIYALLIGALAHDVDHTGQNNDYHIKLRTDLALRYNDESVLENHSISKAHELWNTDNVETNILSGCTHDERARFEEYFHDVILHTDPSKHARVTEQLTKMATERIDQGLEPFDASDPDHRVLIGEMIVHASDISAPAGGDFLVVKDWCQRVIMEFRQQVELERCAGIEVTAFMDGLDSELKVAELQESFSRFMVLPLFKVVSLIFPNAAVMVKNLESNIASYSKIVEDIKKDIKVAESCSFEVNTHEVPLDQIKSHIWTRFWVWIIVSLVAIGLALFLALTLI